MLHAGDLPDRRPAACAVVAICPAALFGCDACRVAHIGAWAHRRVAHPQVEDVGLAHQGDASIAHGNAYLALLEVALHSRGRIQAESAASRQHDSVDPF